ncbi:MAG: DNA polymerase III subunit gamma/tau [Bacteroidaceae bacterium]|nr:DNA polymerase III subunit gamma/tau [Bacteroidaceae bacterium]
MDNFIVSARKYRPQTFNDVVGQQAIANTLKRAIANRKLAGAYLFCGPRGVGKTTCARIFAKSINCLHPHDDGEACNACESCQSFNDGRSMNVQELNAAANNSVDDIRNIIDQVRIPPQLGEYKVIILDEVHMLSAAASNALLKTLEEPPSYVIFILATTEKHKILPTILSRCQIFDFNRMGIEDIIGELKMVAEKEGIPYEEAALNAIAQKADGGMRDSLSIFDQVTSFSGGNVTYDSVLRCLNVLDYEYYFKMTDCMLQHKVSESMVLFNEIVSKGFSGGVFMGGLASHFRDLLMSRHPETTALLDVSHDVRQQYEKQALQCQPKFLYKAIKLCDRCANEYKTSNNKRLSVEIALIEISQIGTPDELDDGAGRGPTKELKPIFTDTNLSRPSAPQRQKAAPEARAARQEETPAAHPHIQLDAQPKAEVQTVQGNLSPEEILRLMNSVSLNGQPEPAPAPQETEQPAQAAEEETPYQSGPVDPQEFTTHWNDFINSLTRVDGSAQGRMRDMSPRLHDGNQIDVWVNSENAVNTMQPYVERAQKYLRRQLKNSGVTLHLKVRTFEEQQRIFNPRVILQDMQKEYPAVASLVEKLQLRLS